MAVTVTIRCNDHPHYRGTRRTDCKACRNIRMFVAGVKLPEGLNGIGGFTHDAIGTLNNATMTLYVHAKA